MSDQNPDALKLVRHFRQILLWPLQLQPIRSGAQIQEPWDILKVRRTVKAAEIIRPIMDGGCPYLDGPPG